MMRGKHLVISLLILLSLLAPIQGAAQECQWIDDPDNEGERLQKYIKIDGEVHFFTDLKSSRKLQKMAEKYPLLKRKEKLLKLEIQIQEDVINLQNNTIDKLDSETQFTSQLIDKAWDAEPEPWYESPEFTFISGVAFASIMYGAWKYADSNIPD